METTTNFFRAHAFDTVQAAQRIALNIVPCDRVFRVASFRLEDRSEMHVVEIQDGEHIVYLKARP